MSGSAKKLLHAAAGSASGDPVYVEDVFSTHLYTGTGSGITINNGIDLDGEGGLVIYRRRDGAENWSYQDTVRGVDSVIYSDSTSAAANPGGYGLASFNSNGFTTELNTSSAKYCSWTFRKQEGFFDIVTYTGDGTSNRQIAHNLGCDVGMMFFKKLNGGTTDWKVFHKGLSGSGLNGRLRLDHNGAEVSLTDNFFVSSTYFGSNYYNGSGDQWVVYLFADGDSSDAQIFGEDGDEAIIKTGTYQSDGNGNEVYVDLGFEPQWIMIKSSTDAQSWIIQDNMRGMAHSTSTNNYLLANSSGAENSEGTAGMVRAESNGMTIGVAGIINMFNSVQTYTYMAIRRGPMKEPSAGTDVYAGDKADTSAAPMLVSNFPVDLVFPWRRTDITNTNKVATRLLGNNMLDANANTADYADSDSDFDFQNGYYSWAANNTIYWGNMFRRYPKVFDVVFYSPLLSDPVPRNVHNHNLTVKPELIIVKQTTSSYGARNWAVGAPDLLGVTSSDTLGLNLDVAEGGTGTYNLFDSNQPTATQFTVGYNTTGVGVFGESYIAYLFASLDGISKVGTYTGTGNDLNVTGLGAAARFVLIKRTDATGDWYVFDTTQGIASGNDPYVLMNSTSAQVTNTDYIDPHSSGFTVTSSAPAALNASGGTYLYLAFS